MTGNIAYNRYDLTGQTFHDLTVIGFAGIAKSGKSLWHCRCSCGKKTIVVGTRLTHNHTKSCGHLQREHQAKHKEYNLKHGHARHGSKRTSEYVSWRAMKVRCTHTDHRYYKAGIRICKRWLNSFENFLSDMGPKPTPAHTIDRINPSGNYTPSNCRWATTKEQSDNRRY